MTYHHNSHGFMSMRLKGVTQRGFCHLHIGRVGSNTGLGTEPEVESAYQQWSNRKRLEDVDQALQEIQSILSTFEKRGTNVMPTETN